MTKPRASALTAYAGDAALVDGLLAATHGVILRSSPHEAADIVLEMAPDLRKEYLARHGVPPLVSVLVDERLRRMRGDEAKAGLALGPGRGLPRRRRGGRARRTFLAETHASLETREE